MWGGSGSVSESDQESSLAALGHPLEVRVSAVARAAFGKDIASPSGVGNSLAEGQVLYSLVEFNCFF